MCTLPVHEPCRQIPQFGLYFRRIGNHVCELLTEQIRIPPTKPVDAHLERCFCNVHFARQRGVRSVGRPQAARSSTARNAPNAHDVETRQAISPSLAQAQKASIIRRTVFRKRLLCLQFAHIQPARNGLTGTDGMETIRDMPVLFLLVVIFFFPHYYESRTHHPTN
jgi:hypothetical protein